jgi:hypothetical protein
MLQAGRAFEVRAWLEPEHEAMLGFTPYHGLRAQAAAACGDYADADDDLELRSEDLRQVRLSADKLMPVRTVAAFRVATAALARPSAGSGPAGLAAVLFHQFDAVRPLGSLAVLLRQEADSLVLRGLLAQESGAVEMARERFRAAIQVWGRRDRPAPPGAGVDFPARRIAQQALRLLEGQGP